MDLVNARLTFPSRPCSLIFCCILFLQFQSVYAAVPAAPTTLAATTASTTQINLTWKDNSTDETGFKIERATPTGSFSQIATSMAASYNNTGLAASTAYRYRVRAYNGSGNSSYSNIVTASTITPTAPSNLVTVTVGPKAVDLTWSNTSLDYTAIKIERATGAGAFAQIATTTGTSYSNTGLALSTSYRYRVRASNGSLNSGYSNISTTSTTTASGPYYLDTKAATNGSGTQSSPWKSASSVSNFTFSAGNIIYIRRGTIVYGQLSPKGSGSAGSPITIGAYTGADNSTVAPLIDASGTYSTPPSAAIWLSNQHDWTIQDLAMKNWWSSTTLAPPTTDMAMLRCGIVVTSTGANPIDDFGGITIRRNEISYVFCTNQAWGLNGPNNSAIAIGHQAIGNKSQFNNVLIEENQISDVYSCGIGFICRNPESPTGAWQNWNNLSRNVVIRGNTLSRTRDGILAIGTDNVLIERNTVDRAGENCDTGSFLVGIQVQKHIGGLIQYNEVSNTRWWVGGGDGQAFDNDQDLSGVTVFQYNYSHGNEGGVFLA